MSDRRKSHTSEGSGPSSTLLLRKLPRNATGEAVRTMLLFTKGLQDTEIIPTELEEDRGFVTALARFSSVAGAAEAQAMLDGKPNTAGHAHMIVELITSPSAVAGIRRNTVDVSAGRKLTGATSPPTKSSRFNDTFQSIERLSPTTATSPPDNSSAESSFQTIFSPNSPANSTLQERARMSGKSMIGEDLGDEETDGLLKDPLSYMANDHAGILNARRHSAARVPVAAFNALSLKTNMAGGPGPSKYASPRSAVPPHTPNPSFSPGGGPYPMGGSQHLRHNYPPVNPADQNPPCNTLYVGNLPMDTSEDELKAMFSKQRGYKRLCFRTKQNGPMCFVEFEDVSFATKALNELYGAQLHNSVKGGIRLSFSKNPLGVRSGQPGSHSHVAPPVNAGGPAMMNGMSPLSPGGFSTANGPPPGLSAPPGFTGSPSPLSPLSPSMGMTNGHFAHPHVGLSNGPLPGLRGVPVSSPGGSSLTGSAYPDYMMGR